MDTTENDKNVALDVEISMDHPPSEYSSQTAASLGMNSTSAKIDAAKTMVTDIIAGAKMPKITGRNLALIFHCLFKVLQVMLYVFSGDSSVSTFVLVSVLIVLDFWTVKNVTGRLLVGLRWWTITDENGKEVYYFENYDFKLETESQFSTVFWTAQISITLFWGFFFFMDLIRFKFFWLCLTMIGGFLSGLNTYFYYKAHKDHEGKLQSTIQGLQQNVVSSFIMNRFK